MQASPNTRGLLFGLLAACLASAALARAGAPSPEALQDAGRRTLEKLETTCATWVAIHSLPTGARIRVEVLHAPDRRRYIMSVVFRGRSSEMARLVTHPSVWFVKQGKDARKCRPFEAPIDLSNAYICLLRAEACFAPDGPWPFGAYDRTKDGVAFFRAPATEEQKRLVQSLSDQAAEMLRREPRSPDAKRFARQVETVREAAARGASVGIDVKTGLVVDFGRVPPVHTRISEFAWLEPVGNGPFTMEAEQWDDYTDDPTAGELADLTMILHSGMWRPGHKQYALEGRLLDVRTGRFRRIPFAGANVQAGCFLKGRTRVVVAVAPEIGEYGLSEVDLKTGISRELGAGAFVTAMPLFPALSPDGKTIAVTSKDLRNMRLEVQPHLVDLASGKARPLGKPLDTSHLSWHPDGKSLYLIRRTYTPPRKFADSTICRIDLDGKLTEVRRGDSPYVLADGKTLLFRDESKKLWKTSSLDGKDERLLAGGLERHGFPAPAPDGKRILMMRYGQGPAPLPVNVEIASGKTTAVPVGQGLWAMPAWR